VAYGDGRWDPPRARQRLRILVDAHAPDFRKLVDAGAEDRGDVVDLRIDHEVAGGRPVEQPALERRGQGAVENPLPLLESLERVAGAKIGEVVGVAPRCLRL